MRLSFVVPVFKPVPEVFERHVKSLAFQAYKDWDVTFVLDGPSQEARRIIGRYLPDASRVNVVEIPHSGAQAARNKGAEYASGEIICFFDSDCIIEPGTSTMWMQQFEKKPEIGFIYSGYKFFGDKLAIDSEPFDPWTLRIRNYISACFPMRKILYPGWAPELESLQDWDMWLSLLEKAKSLGWDESRLGLFVEGYAFSTALPDANSISGKGCTPENWLSRMDAVRKRHGLDDRSVCVTSIDYRQDGIALAKAIGADFLAVHNDKPNRYRTIIQLGFSLTGNVERHSAAFQDKGIKKILFWTSDNINEMWHSVSLQSVDAMASLLNEVCTQYCEDQEAQRLLARAGFKAEVMPIPIGKPNPIPVPAVKKWAVDLSGKYSPMISVIAESLPDIPLEVLTGNAKLSDYTGLLHFFPDKTLSSSVKRAHLTGRHVISNIQQPFCGFVDDKWDPEKFVVEVVDKVRELTGKPADCEAAAYYASSADKLLEVCS